MPKGLGTLEKQLSGTNKGSTSSNSTKGTTTNNSSVSEQSSYISNSGTGTVNKPTNTSNSSSSSKGTASNNTSVTTPTQVNKKDNADIASQYNVSTNGNETTDYSTVSDAIGTSMKNQGATVSNNTVTNPVDVVEQETTSSATDTELGNAIAQWYQQLKAQNDAYYDSAQKSEDLTYDKLRRAYIAQNARNKRNLKNEYAKIGQNPSHSTGWDLDYALSKNLGDLEISKASADSNIAKGRYDTNSNYISNLLGSGLSNDALLKALKGIM